MYADLRLNADALAAATSSLSVDAQKRAEKDAHKKALKAEAAEAKQAATIASSKVIIKRVERNKVCSSPTQAVYMQAKTDRFHSANS